MRQHRDPFARVCRFAQPRRRPNKFVGSDACKVCHSDVWFNFYKNPHYKSIASGKEPETGQAAKDATDPAAIMWRRTGARRPSGRFR